MYIFNSIFTLEIITVREFEKATIKEINYSVFSSIKTLIPDTILISSSSDVLILRIPFFERVRVLIEKTTDESVDSGEMDLGEKIKISIKPENPIRLGTREFNKLRDFTQYSEIIFNSIYNEVFVEKSKITHDYALLQLSRMKRLIEEKIFDIDDEELGATVHGTENEISISTTPMNRITDAAMKYRFR
jgi:hypothetical protein